MPSIQRTETKSDTQYIKAYLETHVLTTLKGLIDTSSRGFKVKLSLTDPRERDKRLSRAGRHTIKTILEGLDRRLDKLGIHTSRDKWFEWSSSGKTWSAEQSALAISTVTAVFENFISVRPPPIPTEAISLRDASFPPDKVFKIKEMIKGDLPDQSRRTLSRALKDMRKCLKENRRDFSCPPVIYLNGQERLPSHVRFVEILDFVKHKLLTFNITAHPPIPFGKKNKFELLFDGVNVRERTTAIRKINRILRALKDTKGIPENAKD